MPLMQIDDEQYARNDEQYARDDAASEQSI